MEAIELLDIINTGETSKVQFKGTISSPESLASELVAMSNSLGGLILIGVQDKTGEIIGLDYKQIQELGQLVGNIAANNVIPIIYIKTEVVSIEDKKILIIYVDEGTNKPYKDRKSQIWIKQGGDKRRVTDNHELLGLFQSGGNLYVDEMKVPNTSFEDINIDKLKEYTLNALEMSVEDTGIDLEKIVNNINIIRNKCMTLGGLLYFGKNPQKYKPTFCIKAVNFFW